mgnify:FL=1
MKTKILVSLVLTLLVCKAQAQVSGPDLVKGYDFTSQTSITGAKLNQVVDNAYVGTYRGMIIYTNNTPNVSAEPKLARYLWLNSGTTPPTPMVWSGSVWTNITATASIADNSVTAGKLAANSVYGSNVVNGIIDYTKIAAGGIVSNNVGAAQLSGYHIFAGSLYGSNIAGATITGTNIASATITSNLIAPSTLTTALLATNFALAGSNILNGTITSTNIATSGVALSNIYTNGATSGQSLMFNAGALTYGLPVSISRSTNISFTMTNGAANSAAVVFAHGLGGTPDIVKVTFVKVANNISDGYDSSGKDEIDINSVSAASGISASAKLVTTVAKDIAGNNIIIGLYPVDNLYYVKKTAGTGFVITTTTNFILDWRIKIVAIKFNY